MQRPVRHPADTTAAGDQLHHHYGQFRSTYLGWFDVGRLQKTGENVESVALHRVGDQNLGTQIFWHDKRLAGQWMLIGYREHGFVGKQRHIGQPGNFLRVGCHHQIQITPGQSR